MNKNITTIQLSIFALFLVFAFGTSELFAQKAPAIASTDLIVSPGSTNQALLPTTITTDFEAGEGFATGFCGGQVGWTAFSASSIEGHIETANPSTGTQHLRIDADPSVGQGSLTGCFSPVAPSGNLGIYDISVDVSIGGTGGADYDVATQATSQGALSSRVKFSFSGDIQVLDDVGAGFVFVDTGADWPIGTYFRLRIEMNSSTGTIDYYIDGTLIYSSVVGLINGTVVDQVVLLSDNFHIGESGDFDNLVQILALPVELTSFDASSNDQNITLSWETASEENNAGFQVEMSKDNLSWTALDFIEGNGSTTEVQNYSYQFMSESPGQHFFRLKQIDFDGKSAYSETVEVSVDLLDSFVLTNAYPNPFNPSAKIQFAIDESQPVEMQLFNAHGQMVKVLYQGVPEADQMINVDIDGTGLSSGLYLVRLEGSSFRTSQTITLQK